LSARSCGAKGGTVGFSIIEGRTSRDTPLPADNEPTPQREPSQSDHETKEVVLAYLREEYRSCRSQYRLNKYAAFLCKFIAIVGGAVATVAVSTELFPHVALAFLAAVSPVAVSLLQTFDFEEKAAWHRDNARFMRHLEMDAPGSKSADLLRRLRRHENAMWREWAGKFLTRRGPDPAGEQP
jgi:hypothetical protein